MAVQARQSTQVFRGNQNSIWRTGLLVAATVAVDTFVNALSAEKLNFLYKNELGLVASSFAGLGIILNIPQYLRPLIGTWTDLFQLGGYHRRSYYLLAVIVEATALFILSILNVYTCLTVALLVVAQCFGIVLMFLMMEATLVRIGNQTGLTSRLQTVQQVVRYALITACTAHLSGFVTQHWSYHRCLRLASITTLIAVPVTFLIDEKPVAGRKIDDESTDQHAERLLKIRYERAAAISSIKAAAGSPGLWVVIGFIFYLILTPGTSTAGFYYQVDQLHFSKQLLGDLSAYSAAGSVIGFVTFALYSPRMPIKALPIMLIALDCGSSAWNFFLRDPLSAKTIAVGGGIVYGWYLLGLLSFGARACPRGVEGTVYGLVYSAQFLGNSLSDLIGSSIYDAVRVRWHDLHAAWLVVTWSGILFSAIGFLFIPLMPDWAKKLTPLKAPVDTDYSQGKHDIV